MTGPDLGRLGAWGHLDSLGARAAAAYAQRAEELGYGMLWVPETVGREPFALIALLIPQTGSIGLGTSIVSIWGRDAQTTRMGAHTLAEASAGRFVLGLGVSHAHLAGKLRGHDYARPLARMREFLSAYRRAIYTGPMPADNREPPLLIAALRERMLALAATEADGAFPYLVTHERLREMRRTLDGAAAAAGRPRPTLAVTLACVLEADASRARAVARAYLRPYLRTPNYHASWEIQGFGPADWEAPASDRLVDAMVAWGPAEALRSRVTELRDAGADHVAVIPLASDGTTEHLPTLEALAP